VRFNKRRQRTNNTSGITNITNITTASITSGITNITTASIAASSGSLHSAKFNNSNGTRTKKHGDNPMTRTVFTTITALPPTISRETVLATLHNHTEMIDLNPSHEERHMIKPPPEATPEEYHCQWYQITDTVAYLPAGLYNGKVQMKACFHDLATGVQAHVYAPFGLDIKNKWTLGGNLPHEPVQPTELGIGAPVAGLYLREDVEIKCNFIMTRFVRKTLKESFATLVARLVVKSSLQEAAQVNRRLTYNPAQHFSPPTSPTPQMSSPLPQYSQLQSPMGPPPMSPPMSPQFAPAVAHQVYQQGGHGQPAEHGQYVEHGQHVEQRYSMTKGQQPLSPGAFVSHGPADYDRVRINELDAIANPPAELA
jgi:hypothetical protein